MLTSSDIASMIDHSMLQPYLTDYEISSGCEAAIKYHTASVCARPADMPTVVRRLEGTGIPACTVIGFPHGSVRPDVKLFESKRALDDGARELDMVINIGRLRAGDAAYVEDEIAAIVAAAHDSEAIVKVILENCYLTFDEIALTCAICSRAGADFVKTSTGFSTHGATEADVKLMRDTVGADIGVKAAGGIRTYADAMLH